MVNQKIHLAEKVVNILITLILLSVNIIALENIQAKLIFWYKKFTFLHKNEKKYLIYRWLS